MKIDIRRIFILTLLLILSVASFGQDSSDVSLICESYDMWIGMGSPISLNGYAYVASNGGFRILDVQDEDNPEFVGLVRLPGLRSNYSCFAGLDSLLFVGIWSRSTWQDDELIYEGGWLQIFDVSNPTEPEFLSEIEINGLSPSYILKRGDTMYMVGDRYELHQGWEAWWYPAIYILNVSDPASPRVLGDYYLGIDAGVPSSIEIHDDLIYAVITHQIGSPAMWIIDLNQEEDPVLVQLDDLEWIAAASITDDYAVVIGDDPDLAVVDISDPENCDIIGTYRIDGIFAPGSILHLRDDFAFVFSQRGVSSFDLSEPENPRLIDELESPLKVTSSDWIQNVCPPSWIDEDRACVTSEIGELLFLDLTHADDIRISGRFTPDIGNFRKVVSDGDRLLVCGRSDGSPILNVADPENLREIGLAPRHYSSALLYENDRIYGAEANRGLTIYNTVNPDSVWFEGRFFVPNYHLDDFELRGDTVYTCGWNSFRIADISIPDSAYQITWYDIYAKSMAMKDGFVYLGGGKMNGVEYENVHILNIANPGEIEEVGLIEMGRAKQIEVEGDMLFVSDFENQLHIFDISQPETPERISLWSNGSTIERYYVEEPIVFMAMGVNGMRVINYSRPARPIETGFYISEDPVFDICPMGNIVYAVDGRTLKMLDVSRALGISINSAHKPFELRLYPAYPNPFNASINILYDVPDASLTNIRIYDISGRLIQTLVDTEVQAGSHLLHWNASQLPAGLYICKMEAKDYNHSLKLMLVK